VVPLATKKCPFTAWPVLPKLIVVLPLESDANYLFVVSQNVTRVAIDNLDDYARELSGILSYWLCCGRCRQLR